jgi:hypothetical protein
MNAMNIGYCAIFRVALESSKAFCGIVANCSYILEIVRDCWDSAEMRKNQRNPPQTDIDFRFA